MRMPLACHPKTAKEESVQCVILRATITNRLTKMSYLRRCSIISLVPAIMLCFSSFLFGQESGVGYGLFGDFNYNIHSADFRTLLGVSILDHAFCAYFLDRVTASMYRLFIVGVDTKLSPSQYRMPSIRSCLYFAFLTEVIFPSWRRTSCV